MIDDRTLGFNFKKRGKPKASGRIEVSTDGKSRIVTMRAIDAKGKKVMSAVSNLEFKRRPNFTSTR